MALPNPNPGGQAGAAVIPFPGGGGGGAGAGGASGSAAASSVKSLVALTKDMVNIQKNILNVLNIIDTRLEQFIGDPSEKREAKDTAGGVSAEKLNWKDIMGKAGGFGNILGAALVAYVYDLDKYIRAAFAAKVLFKPLVNGIRAAFRGIGTAFKALFNTKAFQTAIKPFTTAFDNFMAGFKNVGKIIGAVKTPVAIKEFKTVFGKIGATIGTIVKPLITGFKAIGNFLKPLLSVFKFLGQISGITSVVKNAGGLFSKIMPILKGIGSKFLLPLFAIFDFVSGFIKGFASKGEGDTRSTMERLLDGLAGGFIKMIKGIFIVPLDLLKEGVAWIARQMGFEKFADALDKFSFNDTFDKLIEFGKNLFSSEPEEGYFSIVKWVSDAINTAMTNAKNNLTAVGDVFIAIWKFATNLFSNNPEDGYFSIVNWIAEKISNIKKSITKLFSSSDKDGDGGGFNLSELFGDLDFSFLDPMKIAGKIGEMINNALQSFAQSLDNSIVPGTGSLAKTIANAGVGIAEFMGAENIKKFNVDAKGDNKMEMIKTACPTSTTDGVTTGALSRDVAAKKEGGGGPIVVNQSQKSGDVVTQKIGVSQGKQSARKEDGNPGAGRIK